MSRVAVALVHHPVLDRGGAVITSAITNLDLHDIARSARTYGVSDYFVVHPVAAQRELAERVKAHWVGGSGSKRIPDREPALDRMRVVASLEDAYAALGGPEGRGALDVYVTAAQANGVPCVGWDEGRARLQRASRPALILFGTSWGLAPSVLASADVRLAPIHGAPGAGYNHLSVRAACAIALDRLLGPRGA